MAGGWPGAKRERRRTMIASRGHVPPGMAVPLAGHGAGRAGSGRAMPGPQSPFKLRPR
jgi:hypothetical protein